MLGVGAGRFTVTTSTTAVDAQLDGNLAAQLAKPIARARAATALLTAAGTARASQVDLDDEMLEDYLRAMPDQAKKIVLRIAAGTSPRALILEGSSSASLVEDIVCDLAARGIVTGIEDDMGEDILAPEVTRLAAFADTRAAFGPRTATPEPVPAGADGIAKMPALGACAGDNGLGLCESPEPGGVNRAGSEGDGASLEDAVVREVAFRSPEPAPLGLPLIAPAPSLAQRASAPDAPYEDEGTPPHDQILAMAEATIIENTTYAEREAADLESAEAEGAEGAERSIPIDEASGPMHPSESRALKTPLTAVTTRESELAGLPSKSKTWPMVAFVAAGGVVAWAVLHFSAALASPKQVEAPQAPPAHTAAAKSDATTYTTTVAEDDVAAGHGLLEISAPGDAVILVDGSERGRGGATLPLWHGVHDVRISGVEGEQQRVVEVRAGHVAHIKF